MTSKVNEKFERRLKRLQRMGIRAAQGAFLLKNANLPLDDSELKHDFLDEKANDIDETIIDLQADSQSDINDSEDNKDIGNISEKLPILAEDFSLLQETIEEPQHLEKVRLRRKAEEIKSRYSLDYERVLNSIYKLKTRVRSGKISIKFLYRELANLDDKISQNKSTEEIYAALLRLDEYERRFFEEVLIEEILAISEIFDLELNERSKRLTDEAYNYEISANRVKQRLIEREDILDLAKLTGQKFLLRLQQNFTYEIIKDSEAYREEIEYIKNFEKLAASASAESFVSLDFASELISNLLAARTSLAESLSYSNYLEMSESLQESLDLNRDKYELLHKHISNHLADCFALVLDREESKSRDEKSFLDFNRIREIYLQSLSSNRVVSFEHIEDTEDELTLPLISADIDGVLKDILFLLDDIFSSIRDRNLDFSRENILAKDAKAYGIENRTEYGHDDKSIEVDSLSSSGVVVNNRVWSDLEDLRDEQRTDLDSVYRAELESEHKLDLNSQFLFDDCSNESSNINGIYTVDDNSYLSNDNNDLNSDDKYKQRKQGSSFLRFINKYKNDYPNSATNEGLVYFFDSSRNRYLKKDRLLYSFQQKKRRFEHLPFSELRTYGSSVIYLPQTRVGFCLLDKPIHSYDIWDIINSFGRSYRMSEAARVDLLLLEEKSLRVNDLFSGLALEVIAMQRINEANRTFEQYIDNLSRRARYDDINNYHYKSVIARKQLERLSPFRLKIEKEIEYKDRLVKRRLSIMIEELLRSCLISEYQFIIYTNRIFDKEKLIEIWNELHNKYFKKDKSRIYKLNDAIVLKELVYRPFDSKQRMLALYSALLLWDKAKVNLVNSGTKYSDFVKNSGHQSFYTLMKEIFDLDCFDEAVHKRLAYQLAKFLEAN